MQKLKADGLAEKTKRIPKKTPSKETYDSCDDWQNDDDPEKNVERKIEEWTGPQRVEESWRTQKITRAPTAPVLNLLKTFEAS